MRGLRIALAVALVVLVLVTIMVGVAVFAPGGGGAKEVLAADQTLSFPMAHDVADLDPAQISSPADVDVLRNVFSWLYKFDPKLQEVPDLATGPPTISANGLERARGRFIF